MIKKKCKVCKLDITLSKDKYVLLGTYNGTGKAKKDELYFHFQCWVTYFNERIMQRIQIGTEQVSNIVSSLVNKGLKSKGIKVNVNGR